MCEYFDSHAHFQNVDEVAGLVERAGTSGVTGIIAVGGSREDDEIAVAAAKEFPDIVRAAVGRGRHLAGELTGNGLGDAVAEVDRMSAGNAVAAVGEIGLDFHYEHDTAEAQVQLFRAQLDTAHSHGLPVIVHSREAEEETLRELRAHSERWSAASRGSGIGAVHCFTGTPGFARELLDLGYCLGFSGIISFKNASDLRDVLKTVPDDRLLIETDSPYLAPVPYRGKRNEPAYLPFVAAAAAEARGVSREAIAEITAANALRLFGRE